MDGGEGSQLMYLSDLTECNYCLKCRASLITSTVEPQYKDIIEPLINNVETPSLVGTLKLWANIRFWG